MDTDFSIIVTVKNRLEHFKKTFVSLVTQMQQQTYEIVFVDYASNDNFDTVLSEHLTSHKSMLSYSLKEVKRVHLDFDVPFNSGKAKNLGSHFTSSRWLSFSDVDVFLGMDYHREWLNILEDARKTFFTTRVQETTTCRARRVDPIVNYGNMVVSKDDFLAVGGFDEQNPTWGGDDDDIIHRLKLTGLREINPHTVYDARHVTILHGDEERLVYLESNEKSSTVANQKLHKIYNNTEPVNNSYLKFYDLNKERIHVESVYRAT